MVSGRQQPGCNRCHLLLSAKLWHMQGMDTPFGASQQQEDPEFGSAVEKFSTIDEAAEDIADNWGRAPQPRRDARRQRDDEQGHTTDVA